VPYASLEAIIEQNKEAYYQSLRRTQTTLRDVTPDWESWLHFFLRCLQRQTVRLEERLARKTAPQEVLSPLAAKLAALFQAHATLTLSQAATALDANPHTLKRKFRELIEAGLIAAHGKGRGVFYVRK
jgi:Fic family protein